MDKPITNISLDAAFDELKCRLNHLVDHPAHDNEATRHDRLIVPFLTHPLLLGWDHNDLVAQPSIIVPSQLVESHIFREATPKSRKPDILVTSSAFQFNALVVEEKEGQSTIDDLNAYRFQLHEYQSLYECIWGLLTDGERWILKKGFETHHKFASLRELRAGLRDLQHCIGKQNLLKRKLEYGTCDLVIVVPSRAFQSFGGTVRDISGLPIFLGERDLFYLGNSHSTILKLPPHRAIVVDTGARSVAELLSRHEVRQIELLILTSLGHDHAAGLHRVLDQYRGTIGRVFLLDDRFAVLRSDALSLLLEAMEKNELKVHRLENPDDNPRVIYRDSGSPLELSLVAPSMIKNLPVLSFTNHGPALHPVLIVRSGSRRFIVSNHNVSNHYPFRGMADLKRTLKLTEHEVVSLPFERVPTAATVMTWQRLGIEVFRFGSDSKVLDAYFVRDDGHVIQREPNGFDA